MSFNFSALVPPTWFRTLPISVQAEVARGLMATGGIFNARHAQLPERYRERLPIGQSDWLWLTVGGTTPQAEELARRLFVHVRSAGGRVIEQDDPPERPRRRR